MKISFFNLRFAGEREDTSVQVGLLEHTVPLAFGTDHLSGEERAIYHGFKVDTRRTQFLAGRYVAKETVRVVHPELSPNTINIVHGVWGFPLLHSDRLKQATISIGHAEYCAAALFFHSNTHPLGIDVEEIKEDNLPALKKFITKGEQGRISLEHFDFAKTMHLLWSAKEAAGKALRVGFLAPQDLYAIASVTVSGSIHTVVFEKLPMIRVVGWCHGNHVVCVAFPTAWNLFEIT